MDGARGDDRHRLHEHEHELRPNTAIESRTLSHGN